jgi:hypothetical protein
LCVRLRWFVFKREKKIRTVNGIATLILVELGTYVKLCSFFNYLPECEIVCQVKLVCVSKRKENRDSK